MRNEGVKRIGHLYPKVEITAEMAKGRPELKALVGQKLTVIAWLWARTVKSPNPAFAHLDVPLVSTFLLSTRPGKETYVDPVIEGRGYRFTVKVGKPKDAESAKNGTKLSRGSFRCLFSGVPIPYEYINDESNADRMGARLMAVVADGERGRLYLPPTDEMETAAHKAKPTWKPDAPSRGTWASNAQGRRYGFRTFGDYFTPRQLVALTTFSDLVQEAHERVKRDALTAGHLDDGKPVAAGGTGATAYADAIAVYLGLGIDKATDYNSSLVLWSPTRDQAKTTFSRQAIAMTWDFAEINVFADAAGDIAVSLDGISRTLAHFGPGIIGHVFACDSQTQSISLHKVVSTDPPYCNNIGYADLSDFFYVWLRRSLKSVLPELFATLAVPKMDELVACSYRHGSKEKAEAFFLDGMTRAMHRLAEQAHPAFPVTIYYAFKQSEIEGDGGEDGTASTGWDTFLEAVIRAGFAVTGTWPIRTERGARSIGLDSNALASSIVLVCRHRAIDAKIATRGEFVAALKAELPAALAHLQRGNIAPVDLAQAAIGPGMAVYTRYAKVLDAEGKPLSVREALTLINQTLDEALTEQEGDFDSNSRWALAWFGDHGFAEGPFGDAHTYFLRFNTAENALKDAGMIDSGRSKVRLFKPSELPVDWDPTTDPRLTAWEMVHQLIRSLESGGEAAAAALVAKLGSKAEVARELAYRLYALCERKKRAAEALSYNGLVQSWPEISHLARKDARPQPAQAQLI
jgi:putative DNA methylase